MTLSSAQILKVLQLKGLGRVKALKFCGLLTYRPSNDQELADSVLDCLEVLRLSLSRSEIYEAFQEVDRLLEYSDLLGIRTVSYLDSEYPSQLKEMADFPIVLHIKGSLENLLQKPAVAVIGTRDPSEYGRSVGERIGSRLGETGINVISGLAKGCDTAAHVGCLKAGGITTAVLAHGLDSVYPRENSDLAEKLLDAGGCLVSEYIVKTRAIGNFFVERDRIQAGLAKATVVVETDIKGGTMHTVKYTQNYNRILSVYNHPVNRQTDKSRGNQYLLREGKALSLQTKEDIDQLIEMVNPNVNHFISAISIPIAEMNLSLYDDKELDELLQPKAKKAKAKRKRKSKPVGQQLTIDGEPSAVLTTLNETIPPSENDKKTSKARTSKVKKTDPDVIDIPVVKKTRKKKEI
nr:DNA-processing protein DprA [uncultured Sediminibacterium sp.]